MRNVEIVGYRGESLAQRLARDSRPTPNGCLLWVGPQHLGYGRIQWGGRQQLTHRLALEASGVEVPNDLDVLHSCDTPNCVNPAHLRVGTHQDNMRDRDERGRACVRRGNDCPQARLTPLTVEVARVLYAATGVPVRQIAKWWGVSSFAMWSALRGKSWAHVGGPLA